MSQNYFGIDFGTTNTAVVQLLVDEYGRKVVYCNEEDLPFSSLVAIKKDGTEVLIGRQVRSKRHQLSKDYHIFSSFKSNLEKNDAVVIAGKRYTARDITALFLRGIKNYIINHQGLSIESATFAIPVDFTPAQRRALKLAAESAGIKVNKFISESTAAYMQSRTKLSGLTKVAVFDWGGGTLDISILEITKNRLTELAVMGNHLGGDDIDKLLAEKVHSKIAIQSQEIGNFDDMSDKDRDSLINRSEDAKIALSTEEFYRIRLVDYGLIPSANIPIEQNEFSEIIQPQVDSAVTTLYEAIKKANISVAQLGGIIMAGGSCEMRPIQQIMERLFGSKGINIFYPDDMQWSVAIGAANIDASLTKYRLSNSIGVMLSDDTFFPVLKNDTPVPCKINELVFGIVEDTTDAHFIICDDNKNTVSIINVPVKGFQSEGLRLNAGITEDMIADINIVSSHMSNNPSHAEIKGLNFYYDLTENDVKNENNSFEEE